MAKVLVCIDVDTKRAMDSFGLFRWMEFVVYPCVGDGIIIDENEWDSLMVVRRRAVAASYVSIEFMERIRPENVSTFERLGFTREIPKFQMLGFKEG